MNDNRIEKKKNMELIAVINTDGEFEFDWQTVNEELDKSRVIFEEEIYKRFLKNAYESLLFLGFSEKTAMVSESIRFLKEISSIFIKKLALNPDIELLREKTKVKLEGEEINYLLLNTPYINGSEYINDKWLKKIWDKLNGTFIKEISGYSGSVSDFFSLYNKNIHLAGRIYFHLVESKREEYPFAFLATYSKDEFKNGRSKHLPLKNAIIEYGKDSKKILKLLSTVNKASEKSKFVSDLINSGEIFYPIGMSSKDAYTFLKEVPIYEDAGILCRIPNWWKKNSNSLKISVNIGENETSYLNFNTIVNFNIKLSLGGEPVTIEEIKKLLSETEGLAFIKGKWVEVNHEKLMAVLKAYEQAQELMSDADMDIIEAMRLQLNAEKFLNVSKDVCELEFTNGQWLNSVMKKLACPETIEAVEKGDNFLTDLREYQQRGLNWIYLMKKLGLGACLADDMGLGKTVQVIALLNHIRGKKNEKTLLVLPASLIGNWINEIEKFAPSIKYLVIHPSENKELKNYDKGCIKGYDLIITTYGLLLKHEWLKEINWGSMILDEAQAIKNPGTKQTRAAKKIKASFKLALTGTPIENRLTDLWSLFDFLNKGLLGSTKEFKEYTKQLKNNFDGYGRLKKIVNPFILRRLKTDKSVIKDLPDKIEMKTYSTLYKKQAALYSSLVNELKEKIETSGMGIERKGLVLSSILKLKQICNHPDQYLGQAFYSEKESGKYKRLREICETIFEKRERVLVFTQFKEIVEPLKNFLESIFMHKGLILHGSIPVKKRKEIVNQFQSNRYMPFMVLSIKAGGVGLNLTAANHVIHFDRWWNPAVENQATDRAFRIGQNKNVIVHKFITKGTIEEKIDLMIEDKTKLSRDIISDNEGSWINEMDNEQLMKMFELKI